MFIQISDRKVPIKTSLKFDAHEFGWQFDGCVNDGDDHKTRLSTTCELSIGSEAVDMHIELYEVKSEEDLTAVNQSFQEYVDWVYSLCGESCVQTIKVMGRTYVPVLFPFSR